MSDPQKKNDEFFVGYLPTPPGLGRFSRLIGFALILVAGFVGGLVAAMQSATGDGQWNLNETVTLEGVLTLDPYPMLYVRRDDGEGLEPVFVVGVGKFDARERLAEVANRGASLTGWIIQRGQQRMLELSDEADAVKALPGTAIVPASMQRGSASEWVGEILDGKCWLGVMKPGDGKPHKACASLCLRGGMPALFRTAEGKLLLLATPDGKALGNDVLPYVADRIALDGQLHQQGPVAVLRIEPATIRRL